MDYKDWESLAGQPQVELHTVLTVQRGEADTQLYQRVPCAVKVWGQGGGRGTTSLEEPVEASEAATFKEGGLKEVNLG